MPRRVSYWLLLVTVILLPWYIVRFSVAGIPMTLLEGGALVTFGVWLAEEVLASNRPGGLITLISSFKQLIKRHWLLLTLIGAFGASASLSVLITEDLPSALGIFKAYIVEPILILVVILRVVTTQKAWWGVIAALAVAATSVIGITITQWLWQWPNFAPSELVQGRSSAVYNTANAVGLFIGPLVILAAFLGLMWLKQRKFALGGGALLLCVAGVWSIVLSQSMGAMVALAGALMVGIGGWILERFRFNWQRHFTWVVVAGLAVYILGTLSFMFWLNQPPTVANPYTRPGFSTFTVRQCTWEGTVAALKESPLIGLGLAGFTSDYLDNVTCDAEPLVYPHNFILNFWTELGLVGLLSVLGLVGYWFMTARDLLGNSSSKMIGVALCLSIVYWLIHGLVDVPYFKNDLAMEWWLLFGMTIAARRLYAHVQN